MAEPNSSATNPMPAPIEETHSGGSSLTLSLTPPLSGTRRDDPDGSSTISEHLSSMENDRSMQEIEVSNVPENFALLLQSLPSEDERISQEPKPPSLNNSSLNGSSIISLHGLDEFVHASMEGTNNAKSILEEILNNEQFKSESETLQESLDIFANLDLDDKLLNSYNCEKSANFNLDNYDGISKRVRDFEELIAIKDTTIAALTSELDSFRELLSNTSSLGTSTTEYKQFQEECHNKLVEFHNAIVYKDELIEKLTNSLQQATQRHDEMKQHFKNELAQLQEELEKTSNLLMEHKCAQKTDLDFGESCSKLEAALSSPQISLFNELKIAFQRHIEEKKKDLQEKIDKLKVKFESEKLEQDKEIERLRELLKSVKPDASDLRQELDEKHSKEMEELRTYFEKKCADLEKNYSEEVFSQQSRKLSGSSCSDTDLSSDFVFNHPGPGGDNKVEYTKKDVTKLRQTLTQMADLLDGFNLKELGDEEFEKLKGEIVKFDLRSLLKYDLTLLKNELQNKYHAELEILREDFDNRVDVLNVEHESKVRNLEKKYLEEIEDLNTQLRGRIVTTAQQEVANSGEFEIDEVVQSYERRLQEQVTLAKIDIIAALENQIQRLVASETLDGWPEELLQLKARFAEKYQEEIEKLNEEHTGEMARLKDEHAKALSAALERARRRSLRDADSLSKGELELLKERDVLKKQAFSLRNLLGELIKYFTQCEDELNNTLVEELVTKNFTQIEKELEATSPHDSLNSVKRVHITPNFDDLINLIDNSPDNDLDSIDLKSELGQCLQKLKSEANAILSLSSSFNRNDEKIDDAPKRRSSSLEKEMTSLTRKLINETQIRNDLVEQLNEAKSVIQSLETDRGNMGSQLEELLERQKILERDLLKAKEKITELIENGRREVVSEGYGENGDGSVGGLAEAVASLAVLQEKARCLSENSGCLEPKFVQLIEDLARVGDKIVEEAKRDRDDLKQQIEAADKKYKVTCQFLEEQAAEREQERDETQREIDRLKETLKDREKDRVNCERISNEVEHLEQQIREMSKLMESTEKRHREAENERKEAVDKIYELRDIIRELEDQVRAKTTTEEELRNIVNELEVIVKNQTSEDAQRPREAGGAVDAEKFHRYVDDLESEVQKLRLSSEIAGSEGAIRQIKNHLCDFESTLDKRTKDLEGLHSAMSTTTCSSPSEDVSIRDVVHQEKTIYDECEVPLQQLARLKEKLLRHSRAEDAAVKRIRDLEMQIAALKRELEESSGEREMLKKQIADHLVLISNLQIRLDEQRIRAEHIEKQTNTSLEVQNYDLKNTIASLEERIARRDKTIAQLHANVEETKRHLEQREMEMAANKEDEMVVRMQEQLESLRSENFKLKTRIDKEGQILPNFVENIISDKNSDIELLKERLVEAENQLEAFTSLNLDKNEIESLNKLRLAGVSFHDLIDLDNYEQGRKTKVSSESLQVSPVAPLRQNDKTVFLGSEPEISSIEKIGAANLFYSLQVPHQKANSTEKHVRFEDEVSGGKMLELQKGIAERDERIKDYERRLQRLVELQSRVDQLEVALEETETSLRKAKEMFEEEQRQNEEKMKDLRLELAAQRCENTEKEEELEENRRQLDEEKKNSMEKSKELNLLQKRKAELKTSLVHKDEEIRIHEETLKVQNEELKKLEDEIVELKKRNESIEETINEKNTEITKLKKQNQAMENRDVEMAELKEEKESVAKELTYAQHQVAEKDKIIEQMKIDYRSVHANLESVHNKMQETGNVVDLGKRLREEQRKNSALYEELHELKAQLLSVDRRSLDDITLQVRKELDYSAYLDSTLINAVNDGSLEGEDVDALKLSLKKHKSVNRQLVKSKEAIERKYDDLERKYGELKRELDAVQYEDAVLIGDLRTQHDHAVQKKTDFEKMLKVEKKDRIALEGQLKSMKHRMNLLNTSSLPDMNHEYGGFSKMVADLEEENSALKREITISQESFKRELASKDDEITKLERKISDVTYNEKVLQKKFDKMKLECEIKTNELDRTKKLLEEIDFERKKLAKQLEQRSKSSDHLPEQLIAKIQELNNIAKNDREMMNVIQGLKNENVILEERLAVLENKTSKNLPFNDPTSRANYLFSKCLRMESYRKALVYQKRYLIHLLETYQTELFPNSPDRSTNADWKRQKRKPHKNRFKCVAIVIVSINRMKYMVRRWHSGKRIAEQRAAPQQTVQFQVGQPVSSQNFAKAAKSALNQPKTDMPWFGTSPPSKEPAGPDKVQSPFTFHSKEVPAAKRLPSKKSEAASYQTRQEPARAAQSRLSQDSALSSPLMISKYIERFNQIQDKFGYI